MKNVLITLVSLLVLLVTLNNLQAQDKKSQHKVHIKVKKVIDGKETVIDSVFTIDGDADLDEIMKKLGHDKEMGELHKHEKEDSDVKIEVEKKVERRVIKKGEDGEEIEVQVEVEGGNDEEGNVFIFKSDDGEIIKLDGEKMDKEDIHIIRKKSSEKDPLEDEEIQKMLKEKGIKWEEMDKDKMVIKKSTDLSLSINPIGKEDQTALKELGFEEKDLKNELELKEIRMNVENDGPLMLQVQTEEQGDLTTLVRDAAGEVISKTVLKESSDAYKIYLNLNESGTYYVTLSQGGKSLTQKLVIKKA